MELGTSHANSFDKMPIAGDSVNGSEINYIHTYVYTYVPLEIQTVENYDDCIENKMMLLFR